MLQPILRVRFPVQRGLLDINVLIRRVEIDVLDRRRLTRDFVLHADLFEKRRRDEIHILPRVRKRPHHRQRQERAHGAAVVVARQSADRVVELRRDVVMRALRGFARPSGEMVLEYGQEGLFVADVQQAGFVQIIQALHEGRGAAHGGDQRRHVLGHEEGIEPRTAFVCLVAVGVEIAGGEVEQGRAEGWILETPCFVQEFGL